MDDPLRERQLQVLHELCPPFLAVGLGGSTGASSDDGLSDLDFFLLAPDDGFLHLARTFPDMVSHPWEPLVCRRRGFHPEFGYMYTYVFPNLRHIDYNLNCHGTLARTPMAARTHVTKDLTGEFTEYHERMRDLAGHFAVEEAVDDARGELLVELVRMQAYTRRNELLSVLHRFERLRLVYLALLRHEAGTGSYVPHDADKWVRRDLPPDVTAVVAGSFCRFDWDEAAMSFRRLVDALRDAIVRRSSAWDPAAPYACAVDELVRDIEARMAGNASTPGSPVGRAVGGLPAHEAARR
jgi:hypothetical protein